MAFHTDIVPFFLTLIHFKVKRKPFFDMSLSSLGENGDVEYFEEFPIRLVHKFEGNVQNFERNQP